MSGGMLAWLCLGQGADLHMAQLMPLPLTISCSSKSRLVLNFWCRLTRVVLDRIQQCRKMVMSVYVWCWNSTKMSYNICTHDNKLSMHVIVTC